MFELVLLSIAVVASIGPTNLFAIKEGLKHGASKTFFIVFGGILVDLFYANLAGLGLSAIGENIYFKSILLLIGLIVFVYLGAKGLKIAFQKKMIEPTKIKKKFHPLLMGVVMTLPNPFTIIFWTTAIASLTIGYKPLVFLFVILSVGGVWALLEAGLIHFFRRYFDDNLIRKVDIVTSLIFLGFAVKFMIQFVGIVL